MQRNSSFVSNDNGKRGRVVVVVVIINVVVIVVVVVVAYVWLWLLCRLWSNGMSLRGRLQYVPRRSYPHYGARIVPPK